MSPTIIDHIDYIIVKNAVSLDLCQFLSEYVNFKRTIKPNVRNDTLKGIHREYADPLFENLLHKLTPLIEKATQKELWPTLSFCYSYQKGNLLLKHKDRQSCEFVAGLCIGSDNIQAVDNTWPLYLDIKGQSISPKLGYGDLVIFKGSQVEHWRETFTGEWFVSAIFAYVDKNGLNAYLKYDQRKSLGLPHIGMFRWWMGCLINQFKTRCLR